MTFVGAADFGFDVMNFARESVGWEPLGLGIGIEEGAIDFFRCRAQDAVKFDCAWHILFSFQMLCLLLIQLCLLGQLAATRRLII